MPEFCSEAKEYPASYRSAARLISETPALRCASAGVTRGEGAAAGATRGEGVTAGMTRGKGLRPE